MGAELGSAVLSRSRKVLVVTVVAGILPFVLVALFWTVSGLTRNTQ